MPMICPLLSCGKNTTMVCDHTCTFYHQINDDGRCLLVEMVKDIKSIAADLDSQSRESR